MIERFLVSVSQKARVSVEKELFILFFAQCVNSDRHWLVGRLEYACEKFLCFDTPCIPVIQ